ncbi:MAG: hypothetical protein JW888_04625 [Pirellulales bacterium]|nr:hypothetical protein [Pirellulales bacterium]
MEIGERRNTGKSRGQQLRFALTTFRGFFYRPPILLVSFFNGHASFLGIGFNLLDEQIKLLFSDHCCHIGEQYVLHGHPHRRIDAVQFFLQVPLTLDHRWTAHQGLGRVFTRYEILQILSVSLFEKTPLFEALTAPKPQNENTCFSNQLLLYDL